MAQWALNTDMGSSIWHEELPGLARIEIPLPGNPLKSLNAYLVKGAERDLLVDTGFNMQECHDALAQALSELDAAPDRLDFFITHLHSDHNGLTSQFCSPSSRIFCGRKDGEAINAFICNERLWPEKLRDLGLHGFPQSELDELIDSHPGKIYANSQPLPFTWVEEGRRLQYGPYSLEVIFTPGHTPGHTCLYETNKGFLISGDHILGKITPNITSWRGVADSLGDYLASLEKTARLKLARAFPGHRAIIEDPQLRIGELKAHHAKRLSEALAIVREREGANAWDVASRITWSLRGTWESYGVAQKCFAVGEAAAHLDHLAATGFLQKKQDTFGRIKYV